MARDELRAGFVVSACVVAGIAGVLIGQPVPGAPASEEQAEADQAEEEARIAEGLAEFSEINGATEEAQEGYENFAEHKREVADEAEAEIPAGA